MSDMACEILAESGRTALSEKEQEIVPFEFRFSDSQDQQRDDYQ